jgi:hypothetical protein
MSTEKIHTRIWREEIFITLAAQLGQNNKWRCDASTNTTTPFLMNDEEGNWL